MAGEERVRLLIDLGELLWDVDVELGLQAEGSRKGQEETSKEVQSNSELKGRITPAKEI